MPGSRLPTGTPRQCNPASLRVFSWILETADHPPRSISSYFSASRVPNNFRALLMRRACMPLRNVSERLRQSNASATKRWLMPSAFRLGKGLFVATRGE